MVNPTEDSETVAVLPQLPRPLQAVVVKVSAVGSTHQTPAEAYYTAAQMQAYAAEAVKVALSSQADEAKGPSKVATYWAVTDASGSHIQVDQRTMLLEVYEDEAHAKANVKRGLRLSPVFVTSRPPVQVESGPCPQFPVGLRKMWSGAEVQAWLEANWKMWAKNEPADATLDSRMRAAGMTPLSEMLANIPMERWLTHTGVNDLMSFEAWLFMRREEMLRLQTKMQLDKQEDDELYEWVIAHAAVFTEVLCNFRAANSAAATARQI